MLTRSGVGTVRQTYVGSAYSFKARTDENVSHVKQVKTNYICITYSRLILPFLFRFNVFPGHREYV
jgi:hypothetical protein